MKQKDASFKKSIRLINFYARLRKIEKRYVTNFRNETEAITRAIKNIIWG